MIPFRYQTGASDGNRAARILASGGQRHCCLAACRSISAGLEPADRGGASSCVLSSSRSSEATQSEKDWERQASSKVLTT